MSRQREKDDPVNNEDEEEKEANKSEESEEEEGEDKHETSSVEENQEDCPMSRVTSFSVFCFCNCFKRKSVHSAALCRELWRRLSYFASAGSAICGSCGSATSFFMYPAF